MYGVEYLREFDANDDEHVQRKHRLFELPSGPKLLPDAFDCILSRGVKVKESTVFSRKYCTEVTKGRVGNANDQQVLPYRRTLRLPRCEERRILRGGRRDVLWPKRRVYLRIIALSRERLQTLLLRDSSTVHAMRGDREHVQLVEGATG